MDDLSSKLSEILNDPDSMEQVRRMAEGLLGDDKPASAPEKGALPPSLSGIDLPDGINVPKLMSVLSRLKTSGNDPRTQFLAALKPNLSPERQKKVDTAIKLMRLIELLPFLKESGILNL